MYIKFIPPLPTFRMVVLGPSGVGKSYFIGDVLDTFARLCPGLEEYMWSFFNDDKAYSKRPHMTYMKTDESVIEKPPELSEFPPPNVQIFDDIEALSKEISEAVSRFRDQVFTAGRKHESSAIAVSHEILGGFATKAILNEAHYAVIFPHGNVEPIRKLLSKKYNFSKADVAWVLERKTRWVLIKRSQPQYIMTPTEIRVL